MQSTHRNPWQTLNRKLVYDNKWISVEEHDVINPAGNKGIYGVVRFKNLAIGILPIDLEGNIWLVGQYRYPFDVYTWEIPEGGGDRRLDPLTSAKRELLEETGITAEKYTLIQEFQTSNSCTDEIAYIFIAEQLSFQAPSPDEDGRSQLKKFILMTHMPCWNVEK